MNLTFGIKKWAAWAPGASSPAEWQSWARGELELGNDAVPELRRMPAMQRRRLDRSGRMALHTAWECLDDRCDVPLVFASRNGETPRAVRLLQEMSSGEALSPTDFGLSVHNAVGGLFTIARRDQANCTAVAAGRESLVHGLVEAILLLEDAKEVLLVMSDDVLPEIFTRHADEVQQPYAVSLLLARADEASMYTLSLHAGSPNADASATAQPWGLQLVRMLANGAHHLALNTPARSWHLERVTHAS